MENVLIDKHAMQDIGNAIRTKHNNTTKLKPAEMAPAILSISGEKSSKVTVNQVDHIQTQVNVGFGVGTVVANSGQAVEQSVKPDNLNLQILLNPDYGWKADGYTLSKPSYTFGDDIVITVKQAIKLEDKKITFNVHKASRINKGYAVTPNNNLPEYVYVPELSDSSSIIAAIRNLSSKYAVIMQNKVVAFIALLNQEEYNGIDRSKPLEGFNVLRVNIDDTGMALNFGDILIDFGEGENRYYGVMWKTVVSDAIWDNLSIVISNMTGYMPLTPNTKKINEYFPFVKIELENTLKLTYANVPWEEIRTLGETIGDFTPVTSGIYDYAMTLGNSAKTVQERANAFYILCYYYYQLGYLGIPNKPLDDIDDRVDVIIAPK